MSILERVDFSSVAMGESHFYRSKDPIYKSDLGNASYRLNLSLNSQEETLHESLGAKKETFHPEIMIAFVIVSPVLRRIIYLLMLQWATF